MANPLAARTLAIMATLTVLAACTPPSVEQPSDAPATPPGASCDIQSEEDREPLRWLAENALHLDSLVPGGPWDDLEPLKQILRDVRVVGLGEATHGTREFFTLKHRLVQYLVQEMGFRVVAIEQSYGNALPIAWYVETGDWSLELALRKESMWGREEVRQLLQWMREYNETVAPERQVRLAGFDIQSVEVGSALLEQYLGRVAPEYLREVQTALWAAGTGNPYSGASLRVTGKGDPEAKAEVLGRLRDLVDFLVANETRFVALTSAEEFVGALRMSRNLVRHYDTYGAPADATEVSYKRDRYMAETILEMLAEEGAETRMVVWAHNAHVADAPNWMGSYLRQAQGEQYYALGLLFNKGSFLARLASPSGELAVESHRFEVSESPRGTSEWYLACAGLGNTLLDLRQAPKPSQARTWLERARPLRFVGSFYDPTQPEPYRTIPLTQFDGLVYIPETSNATTVTNAE